ncbi:MAG: SgcJ/EcaC family oxidoreductase [Nitrospiraceae bacterium]
MRLETFEQLTSSDAADETAVRALYQQMMDGWNQGSGEAFAAPFAENGDLIGFDGTHFEGRLEIAPFHQRLFDTYLKGTRLTGQVTSIRFLSPDVALMHAVGGTVKERVPARSGREGEKFMRGKSLPSPERDSIQTLVATKRGGEWRLAAFQNTRIRPIGRNVGGTLVWIVTDWLWRLFRPMK